MYRVECLDSAYGLRNFLNKHNIETKNVVSFSRDDSYTLPWILVYFEPEQQTTSLQSDLFQLRKQLAFESEIKKQMAEELAKYKRSIEIECPDCNQKFLVNVSKI